MKVLYIHQHFSTRDGHTGTRSYEFARYLVKQGHEVVILAGRNARSNLAGLPGAGLVTRLRCEGFDVVSVGVRYANTYGLWRRVWAFLAFVLVGTWYALRENGVDVVFATSTPLSVGAMGICVRLVRGIPFVFEVRDLWPESAVAMGELRNPLVIKLAERLERLCYKHARSIVVISEGIAASLRQRGIPKEKVVVIRIGADLDLMGRGNGTAFRSRQDLGQKFVVLYAGAMGKANGLDSVLDAAARIREEKGIIFVLIGDGRMKSHLQRRVSAEALENVRILDPVPKTEMPDILAAADACLMSLRNVPVFQTASPNKFFDYLAAGRPVIVNFPGEIESLLAHHKAGLAVTPDDPDALAAAIRRLQSDPEGRALMGARARRVAEENFDRQRLAATFEQLLRDVATNGSGQHITS